MRAEHRAFLREHSDVGTFVDQHIAAGAYSQRLAQIYENYFGHDKWVDGYLYIYGTKEHFIVFLETLFNREAVKSFNPLKTKIFTSPWAVRRWLVVVVVVFVIFVICIELGNNSCCSQCDYYLHWTSCFQGGRGVLNLHTWAVGKVFAATQYLSGKLSKWKVVVKGYWTFIPFWTFIKVFELGCIKHFFFEQVGWAGHEAWDPFLCSCSSHPRI